ncbi:MAG: hypothetical protein ACP5D1_03530 [Bacteroidales bacterium]
MLPWKASCQISFFSEEEMLRAVLHPGRERRVFDRSLHDPSLSPVYYTHYSLAVQTVLFQDPVDYDFFLKGEGERLELFVRSATRTTGPSLQLSAMYLQSAMVYLCFGEEIKAGRRILQAFRTFTDIPAAPADPQYLKIKGLFIFIAGNFPRPLLSFLPGMSFSPEGYSPHLEKAASMYPENSIFRREIQMLHALCLLADDQPLMAGSLLGSARGTEGLPALIRLVSLKKAGKNEEVIRESGYWTVRSDIPWFEYLLGEAWLRKGGEEADACLDRFLERYRGGHYRKSALLKRAWAALLHGRDDEYMHFIDRVKTEGYQVTEADRHAMAEAGYSTGVHRGLLQARLLFDGGYYYEALQVMQQVRPEEMFQSGRLALEYTYRMGRILQKLGRDEAALKSFDQTIGMGMEAPWYYPAYAAWQAGHICEKNGYTRRAGEYYRLCLQMKTMEYRSFIRRKARRSLRSLAGQETGNS